MALKCPQTGCVGALPKPDFSALSQAGFLGFKSLKSLGPRHCFFGDLHMWIYPPVSTPLAIVPFSGCQKRQQVAVLVLSDFEFVKFRLEGGDLLGAAVEPGRDQGFELCLDGFRAAVLDDLAGCRWGGG